MGMYNTTIGTGPATQHITEFNRGLVTAVELVEMTRGGDEAAVLLVLTRDCPSMVEHATYYYKHGDWSLAYMREFPAADPFYTYQGMSASCDMLLGHRFVRVSIPGGEVLTLETSYAETADKVADALRQSGYQTHIETLGGGILFQLAAFKSEPPRNF